MALYRERYGDVGLYENDVYDGVSEMLETARSRTTSLFVATAKPAVFAERIARHFGLDRYFTRIYGAELGGRFDDKADLLAHALAAEGLRGPAAVMIGDRGSDVAAARANGARAIGVLWGYGSRAELAGAGAETLCPAPAQLAHCLLSLGAI
jgi:phosphoglycolate phosphatase